MTGRTVLMAAGAVAIVAASFLITLNVLNYLDVSAGKPQDANTEEIDVVEATYGMSCEGKSSPSGKMFQVQSGNFTAMVDKACNNTRGSCTFVVDVEKLGDPAPDCDKDFRVSWRCGSDATVHQTYLPVSADFKHAVLVCPAH